MALYREGTASINAQGDIVGVGTKWQEPLSLIRTGATILFLDQQIKFAVISNIISNTQMKGITSAGAVTQQVPYVILLNDSLTVDGMAQDIAETLRYYQGKETEMEKFVELVKDLDYDKLKALVTLIEEAQKKFEENLVEINKKAAEVDKNTKQVDADLKTVQGLKMDVTTLKNQTEGFKNTAASEAKKSTEQAERSKSEADRAAAIAGAMEVEKYMKKEANLSDVQDKIKARENISIDRFNQLTAAGETNMQSANKTKQVFVKDGGSWGCWDSAGNKASALGVSYGGTGALDADGARKNFEIERFKQHTNDTYIYAGASKVRLSLNSGFWGMYDEGSSSWIHLPVYAGGTGAGTKYDAARNLGTIYFNSATIGTTGDMNNFTGSDGSGGEIFNVAATNSHGVANWPNHYSGRKAYGWGGCVNHKYHMTNGSTVQHYYADNNLGEVYFRIRYGGGNWRPWAQYWTTRNTTIDANGFIKRASPIVKVFSDGSCETNAESEGATVDRLDVGVYKISNVLGLNSDPSWGGAEGGFEIPVDRNKNPTIWLDYEVDVDGSILVKTYHRTNPSAPAFARNLIGYKDESGAFIETVKDGDPVDIPQGVFVSVRVQMPSDSIHNLRMAESEGNYDVFQEDVIEQEPINPNIP